MFKILRFWGVGLAFLDNFGCVGTFLNVFGQFRYALRLGVLDVDGISTRTYIHLRYIVTESAQLKSGELPKACTIVKWHQVAIRAVGEATPEALQLAACLVQVKNSHVTESAQSKSGDLPVEIWQHVTVRAVCKATRETLQTIRVVHWPSCPFVYEFVLDTSDGCCI